MSRAADRPLRVAHVITGLGTGGAEAMLTKLVEQLRQGEIVSDVISLRDRGDQAGRLEAAGAQVFVAELERSAFHFPRALFEVGRLLRTLRPDVVQTWMYHADLVGGLAATLSGSAPVVWSLRQSNLGAHLNRRSTLLTMWSCARLSSTMPSRIICNSSAAARSHRAIGYDDERMVVIPNGFDVERFRPDPEAKRSVAEEVGIPFGSIIVGCVTRWDPQKDVAGFLRAMGIVADVMPDVHVVACGMGITVDNPVLRELVAASGHGARIHLLGPRNDPARVIGSFDIAVSSSVGESFSNAIGEAMACAVPCVVTDVGDSRRIVGETGLVVPPSDTRRLAAEIVRLAQSSELRAQLGAAARERVAREYGLESVARRYARVWKEVVSCAA